MSKWLVYGVLLVAFDIFLGIPIMFILSILNIDLFMLFIVGVVFVLAPLICFMQEMNVRRKYPIRCTVSYTIGESSMNRQVIMKEDRIGYVDVIDQKNEKAGKEWRLADINKSVLNFEQKYIYQREIWFGFKTAKWADVFAVATEKGEEFRPMQHDAVLGKNTPIFDGDKGTLFHKIRQDIIARNKIESWWRTNLPALVLSGLAVVACVLLLMITLNLKEVSGVLSAALERNEACSASIQYMNNQTLGNSTAPKAGNVGGIPFGVNK